MEFKNIYTYFKSNFKVVLYQFLLLYNDDITKDMIFGVAISAVFKYFCVSFFKEF